jgi:ketosteroid isomerase-like protein
MHLLAALMLVGQMSLADSVKQTFRDYEKRLNAGDYAGLAEYYADDPRFYWVEHGTISTRAQVLKELGQMPAGAHFTYAEPRVTIVDSGVALLTTSYTGTMGATKFSGSMTITLIRTSAGWRFLAGHS